MADNDLLMLKGISKFFIEGRKVFVDKTLKGVIYLS